MKRTSESQLSVFGGETAGDLIIDFMTDGYSLAEHGASEEQVDSLIVAYANFTDELPDPDMATLNDMMDPSLDPKELEELLDDLAYEKDTSPFWHKYRTNHPRFAKPGGYTNRSLQVATLSAMRGVEMVDDPKEYYHYDPAGIHEMEKMHDALGWGPIPPEVKELHMRFQVIHELAVIAMTGVYRKLELDHPELLSRFATPKDFADSPIRLLFYHPGQGDLLAGGHYDKGLGTMQVAESHRGFRALKPLALPKDHDKRLVVVGEDGTVDSDLWLREAKVRTDAYKLDPLNYPDMQLLDRDPKYGIVFPSKAWRWENVYPNSVLIPTWHDVINLPELNTGRQLHGKNCARWAIILFTNSRAAGKAKSKAEMHGGDMVLDLSEAGLGGEAVA